MSDEAALLLSDIFPTGFEIGVQYGQVKPGDTVAVVGAGPVGLAVIATAGLYGAAQIVAIDLDENRLDLAKQVGATHCVNSGAADWKEQVLALTDGYGVDVAVEAVGVPATFDDVHRAGAPRRQRRERRSARQAGAARRCRTCGSRTSPSAWGWSTPRRWRCCSSSWRSSKLPVEKFVTHRFALDDIITAYETFGNAAETHALKVVMSR